MAVLNFKHSQITGICTVVPEKKIDLDSESQFYDDINKIKRLKMVVGLGERSVADADITPSDLMQYAAEKLIFGMNLDVRKIDALICVLDNPDYKCPPTSCVLHGKLNFPISCMAFDINHGCAGYIYGLSMAYSLIESGLKKVLLLVGDTKSHTINIKDRIAAPLFGDGASATLIEECAVENNSYFVIGTEGKQYENIIIYAGGARVPYSENTSFEKSDDYGNIRSLNNFKMNGKNVFDFTMNYVPKNIVETLDYAGVEHEDIDYFVLHQANKSIIHNIASRIGVKDRIKFPVKTLEKYGNLAVASIPSVLNDQLFNEVSKKKVRLLLSGFGVGLAFGSAIVSVNKIYAPSIYMYKGEQNG